MKHVRDLVVSVDPNGCVDLWTEKPWVSKGGYHFEMEQDTHVMKLDQSVATDLGIGPKDIVNVKFTLEKL